MRHVLIPGDPDSDPWNDYDTGNAAPWHTTCPEKQGALWRHANRVLGLDCYSYRKDLIAALATVQGFTAKKRMLDEQATAEIVEGAEGFIFDAAGWREYCGAAEDDESDPETPWEALYQFARKLDNCPGAVLSRLDPHGLYTPDGRKLGSSCGCEDYPCCGH